MATYTVTDGQSQSFNFAFAPTSQGDYRGDQINVSGAAAIDAAASGYETLTVNLAPSAQLAAGFHFSSQNTLNVTGDASTTLIVNSANSLGAPQSARFQSNVSGTGSFAIGPDGNIDFAGGVGDGITVNANGTASSAAIVILEQPTTFKGAVNLTESLVALRGLDNVTDYSFTNGALTVYGGSDDHVLDTLRLTDTTPDTPLMANLVNGEVDIFEASATGFASRGPALAQHVAPQPPAPQAVAVHDNTTGADVPDTSSAYSGPVSGIGSQYINVTPDNLNIVAKADNLFIKTGGGNDAVALHSGTNVVDAGGGSNFLTSGGGFDTFFLDARNIPAASSAAGPVPGAIWDTVQGFGHGDAVTLWGIGPGTALAWQKNEGAVGHTGLTLHAITPNGATTSLTLAGVDDKSHLALSYGQSNGANYLYVKAV